MKEKTKDLIKEIIKELDEQSVMHYKASFRLGSAASELKKIIR